MIDTQDRLCKDCNEVKPCRRSGKTSSGKPQYRTRCLDCYQKWETAYKYGPRKEKTLAEKRKRDRDAKVKCVKYLGGSCHKCGYSKSMRALTFHHIDRATKQHELAAIKDHNWEKVKQELDKCILVCFNCHMEEEELYDADSRCAEQDQSASQNLGANA